MVDVAECRVQAQPPALPYSAFSTVGLPPREALAIWRESLSPVFDSVPTDPGEFYAQIQAYLLGDLAFGHTRASSQRFRRDRSMRKRNDVDHFLVQVYRRGSYEGEHRRRPLGVREGDLSVLDLGLETDSQVPDFDCLSLVVPRDTLLSLLAPGADPGGTLIPRETALGRILANQLQVVWCNLGSLSRREVGPVREALLGVLAAGLREDWDRAGAADPASPLAAATLAAMQTYIEGHLEDRDLTPARLCRTFHYSRSALYRLFEPAGGVARFIRERRLARCYRELSRPGGAGRGIGELANHFGFVSQSHFTRLFQQTFGVPPTLAQRQALAAPGGPDADSGAVRPDLPAYRQWLLKL